MNLLLKTGLQKKHTPFLLASLLFAGLTVAWLQPLSFSPGLRIQDTGDSLLNCWILAWDAHALATDPLRLFEANIFHPAALSLAFSEHLLGIAIWAWPIITLTGNPILAHNLMLMFSFFLSGMGVCLLVRKLTNGDWLAGLAAGVAFAFCPYRLMQLGHLQVLSVGWFPLALLFLHRFVETRRYRDLAGMGCFYLLQALSCGYHALYAGVLLALAWVILSPRASLRLPGYWGQGVVLALAMGLILAPFFLPYTEVRQIQGFNRSLSEVTAYSADLMDYLTVPKQNIFYGPLLHRPGSPVEGSLFPGLGILLLALVACFPVSEASGRKFGGKWLSLAYLGLALIAFSFSLGPSIRLNGQELVWGPYSLLYAHVPGFDGVRVPARFGMFTIMFLAVAAGLGVARLRDRLSGSPAGTILGLAVVAFVLVEVWHRPLPNMGHLATAANLPAHTRWLAARSGPGAVWHLPCGTPQEDVKFVYLSSFHFRPMVNGYSGHFPKGYQLLATLAHRAPTRTLMEQASRSGVRWVLVHGDRYADKHLFESVLSALKNMPGLASQAERLGRVHVFELHTEESGSTDLSALRPEWVSKEANPNHADAAKAFDGDPATRWTNGQPQKPGPSIKAVWRQPLPLSGIELDMGFHWQDYPRGLTVSLITTPGGEWKPALPVEELTGVFQSIARPLEVRPAYRLTWNKPVNATGFRADLAGSDPAYYWSVSDVRLLMPSRTH